MNNEFKDIPVDKIFARNVPGIFEILKTKCVGIAGCGGLGSNVAVMLTRSGIGKLVVADFDVIAFENLNRQHFFLDQIGKPKVDALGEMLERINPSLEYTPVQKQLSPGNIESIFGNVDVMVEAFDLASEKQMLIDCWLNLKNDKPIVAVSGVAGLGGIDKIRVNRLNNLIIVGDFETDLKAGLIAPKVMMVASVQAEIVIELLMENK
jgi:sulfur carrier protein ThiS adenylyltransferase